MTSTTEPPTGRIPGLSDFTLVERSDGLVTVTFNRPAVKNALNAENWQDLDLILTEVTHNPDDRALLITGAGGNFSSGADLSGGLNEDAGEERTGLTGRRQQSTLHEMRNVNLLINRLHRMPKPTIAAVDGVAIGVSLGLALACDLIVASDRARFCEIFVKRGLALDGGSSWTLPRNIGVRRAKQMTMLGDMVGAEQALAWGLVNEVVPVDDLLKVATDMGRRLAAGPTTALSLIKRLIDDNGALTFEQALEEEARAQHIAFTTSDMHEGVLAFVERRQPNFTGA
ncbi:enoyl-CoA hydratase [Microtetraspora sp. NBRC 16547]|uniref:enoyl-CoA hydratase/isomerase family protein n=1 Tax=Microtetraspora sp. NBRC 16547 TaxID=3030993 RepID=UPI0024A391C2|nr:enoyl-CoA hydratase [Microtetraspora sp. NBRC 16547]GLX02661.1 2-(1,2-epoxy-1,2-dihydrophenyl)acetyl-CoA isomerase [Microtetraspora sp. NBRC 16547]